MHTDRRTILKAALALAALSAARPPVAAATAAAPPMGRFAVRTGDGLTLSAEAFGDPAWPELVLIHGLGQSRLSWAHQVGGALEQQFRVVIYDLRGHGDSDKPADPAAYGDGSLWGDDLAAVIAAAGLHRPVLAGWSLGGVVIANYILRHGVDAIAGLNLVDAVTKLAPDVLGQAALALSPRLADPDLGIRTRAIADFLAACFARPPARAEFERMLVFNGMVPPAVHAGIGRLDTSRFAEAFGRVQVPILITHGDRDALTPPAMAAYSQTIMPKAKLSLYAGIGHAPFVEDPDRFNRELAAFVRSLVPVP